MKVSERLSAIRIQAFAVGALIFALIALSSPAIAQQTTMASDGETVTVRDSLFTLLGGQTIPSNGYIHLYDSTPYFITNGHVAAKIPCDDDSTPMLDILVGQAPNLSPASIDVVANLSVPGQLCLYHADLLATEQANATDVTITNSTTANTTVITDIAISNPDDQEITLPSTSTVVIGVNEIAKGLHGHDEEHQDGIP